MAGGRARVAASILDADLANLAHAVRRVVKAGADRIHLDVMDGHFVPNLTFGARTIRDLRRITDVPFDAHLMISEPGRYIHEYLEAGCDSVTFHVEIDEPIEPTLRAIRAAGRAAGLSVKPGTPLETLDPYRALLDIVLVMTDYGERRFIAVGVLGGRYVSVVYTDRSTDGGHMLRRIISARRSSRREREAFSRASRRPSHQGGGWIGTSS